MNDDQLSSRLAAAFAPEPVRPPEESVAALRRAAEELVPRRRRPNWRPRAVTAVAVFGTVLGSSTAAFALSGAPLPEPLRVIAHGVGLPVDSVNLAEARSAVSQLGHALRTHDASQIARAADALRSCLAGLSPSEKGEIDQQAAQLLNQALEPGATTQADQQQVPGNGNAPAATSGTPGGAASGPATSPMPVAGGLQPTGSGGVPGDPTAGPDPAGSVGTSDVSSDTTVGTDQTGSGGATDETTDTTPPATDDSTNTTDTTPPSTDIPSDTVSGSDASTPPGSDPNTAGTQSDSTTTPGGSP